MAKETDGRLIELCMECRDHCATWLQNHNIQTASEAKTECARLMLECYDICAYTVVALQRETPFSKDICQLCELISEACGNECNAEPSGGLEKIADICYEVADGCRQRLY